MRLCFFNVTASFIPGGLETYCWEVGRAMSRRGHEVSIVAGDRGEARHDEVSLVRFPFRIEQEWPRFGTRFRRLMERLSFAAAGALDHLIDTQYDAVIVNKPFDFPILWQARRCGMRSQTLFRSGGTDFFAGDRWFAGAIDHWVSTSRYNADQIEARYGRRVTVIHNGVDTERFAPGAGRKPVIALPPDSVVVVSVGRLVGWKGLHVVLEALAGLPTHVHHLVIGDGPERAELEAMTRRLGVSDRVHFAGRVAHAELPYWLACGDVFVQPSIGEEAFGISVVEAMACGLPVLASDNGGMRETVVSGETGWLLPPGDVAAWRETLDKLVVDAEQRRTFGAASRRRAVDHFTWAANAASVERLLVEG